MSLARPGLSNQRNRPDTNEGYILSLQRHDLLQPWEKAGGECFHF